MAAMGPSQELPDELSRKVAEVNELHTKLLSPVATRVKPEPAQAEESIGFPSASRAPGRAPSVSSGAAGTPATPAPPADVKPDIRARDQARELAATAGAAIAKEVVKDGGEAGIGLKREAEGPAGEAAEADGEAEAASSRAPSAKKSKAEVQIPRDSGGNARWMLTNTPQKKRRVTVTEFKGNIGVHFHEFFEGRNGAELPTKKGLWLNADEWKVVRNAVDGIDKELDNLQQNLLG